MTKISAKSLHPIEILTARVFAEISTIEAQAGQKLGKNWQEWPSLVKSRRMVKISAKNCRRVEILTAKALTEISIREVLGNAHRRDLGVKGPIQVEISVYCEAHLLRSRRPMDHDLDMQGTFVQFGPLESSRLAQISAFLGLVTEISTAGRFSVEISASAQLQDLDSGQKVQRMGRDLGRQVGVCTKILASFELIHRRDLDIDGDCGRRSWVKVYEKLRTYVRSVYPTVVQTGQKYLISVVMERWTKGLMCGSRSGETVGLRTEISTDRHPLDVGISTWQDLAILANSRQFLVQKYEKYFCPVWASIVVVINVGQRLITVRIGENGRESASLGKSRRIAKISVKAVALSRSRPHQHKPRSRLPLTDT
ncbi:hypothetical protein C8F01DRAFT_1080817 [Mycena amicta]|nr:hypothetical protein C8F01DRAFT_1080817 [Mycena amicta]